MVSTSCLCMLSCVCLFVNPWCVKGPIWLAFVAIFDASFCSSPEFISTVAREKADVKSRQEAEIEAKNPANAEGPLDPMIRGLLGFVEHGDLSARISKVFQRMDLDENGGISFTELNAGLKKLFHKSKAACQLSLEDFEHVTAFGDLTDENDELDLRSFETMVMMQMRQYVNRQICAAIKRTNDDVTAEQMFGIKMIMLNLQMLENRFDRAFPESHQYKKKTSLKQLSLTQNGEDGSNVNPLPSAEPSVLRSDASTHGPDAVPIVSPASIDAIDFSVSADKTMKDLAVKAASLDSMMQKVSFSVLPFLHYMSHSIAPSVSLTLFCTPMPQMCALNQDMKKDIHWATLVTLPAPSIGI